MRIGSIFSETLLSVFTVPRLFNPGGGAGEISEVQRRQIRSPEVLKFWIFGSFEQCWHSYLYYIL